MHVEGVGGGGGGIGEDVKGGCIEGFGAVVPAAAASREHKGRAEERFEAGAGADAPAVVD